jgi:hypothetical protein
MIKYIKGSWFEFQHPNIPEGKYMNAECAKFTCRQWDEKIKEMSEMGMEYLVLLSVALDGKVYYKSDIHPNAGLGCIDPVEAALSSADKYGMKFFVGAGFFGNWADATGCMSDVEIMKTRLKCIDELAEKYGHHKSFYGWYWPDEAYINKYYSEHLIKYVNDCSAEARKMLPSSKALIAPYGTRVVVPDNKYVKQLENLNVDFIAYQDEIGVQKTKVEESAAFYEGLKKAHDKAGRAALWADVEVFEFEGPVYHSALLPAKFSRIEKQLEAVSPYVDNVLVYTCQGMMNKPNSGAFTGHPDSVKLYTDYTNWLKKNYPSVMK